MAQEYNIVEIALDAAFTTWSCFALILFLLVLRYDSLWSIGHHITMMLQMIMLGCWLNVSWSIQLVIM